jgi:hypothetical protein
VNNAISTSFNKNKCSFCRCKEDIAEAKRAASDLKKAFEKIQDPKMNFKRMKRICDRRSVKQKANKNAAKPRSNDEQEKARGSERGREKRTAA